MPPHWSVARDEQHEESNLLGGEIAEEAGIADNLTRRRWTPARKVIFTSLGLVALVVLAIVGWHYEPQATAAPVAELGDLEEKVELVTTGPSTKRHRKKLRIERDLGAMVTEGTVGKGASQAPASVSECTQQAHRLFDSVMMRTGLDKELDKEERSAFRTRFSMVMDEGCKNDPLFISKDSHWIDEARRALEEEKPVMTKALAHNLNRAEYGFKAEMREWMVHESKKNFRARLGRTATPPPDVNVSEPHSGRQGGWVPQSFNSATHWPHCQQEILRIHDQGICGSCWSFSCSQVLNARICIQSHGRFNGADASVAPGFFASCAPRGGYPGDGCKGGWEYFCYKYIDRWGTPGAVSESCSPYFGVGTGINHFTQKSNAPGCPTRCRQGYQRSLAEDGFKLPGVGRYRLLMPATRDAHAEAKQAIYQGGTINHGIFATGHFMGYSGGVYNICTRNSANHAVVTYGWFPGGYLSKNSWGPHWGEGGLMRLADCMITDFTIPGFFRARGSHIPYPLYHR